NKYINKYGFIFFFSFLFSRKKGKVSNTHSHITHIRSDIISSHHTHSHTHKERDIHTNTYICMNSQLLLSHRTSPSSPSRHVSLFASSLRPFSFHSPKPKPFSLSFSLSFPSHSLCRHFSFTNKTITTTTKSGE